MAHPLQKAVLFRRGRARALSSVLASQIVRALPGSLEWMVLFDLSTLRRLVADETVRAMYYLPRGMDLDPYSHVVLTSQGTLVALRDAPKLLDPPGETIYELGKTETSLYQRFTDRFDLFPSDDADCLGFGETPPFPPVLLHLRAKAGYGEARAVFAGEPTGQNYELLEAIGVEYLGGSQEGPHYVARFRNHLPTHIHAGILAHFSRTSHCNLFFLRHGSIDGQLERGLVEATTSRITWSAGQAREAVLNLAEGVASEEEQLALTRQSTPDGSFAPGDAVPVGFLLGVLNSHTSAASIFSNFEARKNLMANLQRKRQGSLWPHQKGGPVSSTATALVLHGLYDPEGVEALEAFADGRGGYYSHLGADERGGQADYATTCLIRALRQGAGLEEKVSAEYLRSGFQSRSGWSFANPYLVDWALALALEGDESAQDLRDRLAGEILDSMNDDHSFGVLDVPTSSAFAILGLAALGRRDRTLLLAQLRLMDFMGPDGTFPPGTPFYCTGMGAEDGRQEVSPLFDSGKAISTSAAALALLVKSSPATAEESEPAGRRGKDAHPRYGCRDHVEYVRRFANPSYADDRTMRL